MCSQGELKWTSKAPLCFQEFNNNYFSVGLIKNGCPHSTGPFYFDCWKVPRVRYKSPSPCPNLLSLKKKALGTIYPETRGSQTCTVMLFSNVLEPTWLNVECKENILNHVLCMQNHTTIAVETENTAQNHSVCSQYHLVHLIVNKTCFYFQWTWVREPEMLLKNWAGDRRQRVLKTVQLLKVKDLFLSVQAEVPLMLTVETNQEQKTEILMLVCKKALNKVHCRNTGGPTMNGFFVFWSSRNATFLEALLFQCKSGGIILSTLRCDGDNDCPNDTSDEELCSCSETESLRVNPYCRQIFYPQRNRTVCGLLFFTSSNGQCLYYTSFAAEENKSFSGQTKVKNCSSPEQIHSDLGDDLIIDCPNSAHEESTLINLLRDNTKSFCSRPSELPCKQWHSTCFGISQICSYSLNDYGYLKPCRNGGHLEDCTNFECVFHFKCFQSYCVPWSYMCDGKWDCPKGEDETFAPTCGNQSRCENMLKCKNIHTCISLRVVCNDQIDCPFSDDEALCELRNFQCPEKCHCLALALSCYHLGKESIPLELFLFFSVSIQDSPTFFSVQTATLPSASFLILTENDILEFTVIKFSSHLVFLNISSNIIATTNENSFPVSLQVLILDKNNIRSLKSGHFSQLDKLKYLSLSHNPIKQMPAQLFNASSGIKLLIISNIRFQSLDTNTFQGSSIQAILTDDYAVCCVSPKEAICTALLPRYRTCSHLLPEISMKVLFICISLLSLLINFCCIVMYTVSTTSQKTFSISVIVVNASNMLCVVYLKIIWANDLAFKDKFIPMDKSWRTSHTCFIAFGTLLWFSVGNQLLLIFLSLSRLMVVAKPIGSDFKRTKFVAKALLSCLIISLAFSMLLSCVMKFHFHKIPHNLCVPFTDPTKSFIILTIVTWFLVLSQMLSTLSVPIMHILLVYFLLKSQRAIHTASSSPPPRSNSGLILQLSLLSLSTLLCWIPANIVNLLTMFLPQYPPGLIFWAVIGIMPLNSLLIPAILVVKEISNICAQENPKPNKGGPAAP